MRVRIDERRETRGRQASVAQAHPPRRHLLGQPLDQGVNLGGALYHGEVARVLVEDGHAGRVVAAVLQPLEAVHDDGSRRPFTQVADDPAHLLLLCSHSAHVQTNVLSLTVSVERPRAVTVTAYGEGEVPGIFPMKTCT